MLHNRGGDTQHVYHDTWPHLAQADRQPLQEPWPRPLALPPAGQAALDTGRGGSVLLLGNKVGAAAVLC